MTWLLLLIISRESREKPNICEVEWESDSIYTVGARENKSLEQ